MMTGPVMAGPFLVLMLGTVGIIVAVAAGVVLLELRRGTLQRRRGRAPGTLDEMTDSLHGGAMGTSHLMQGPSAADRLIATGIAVDALGASEAASHGHGHSHSNAGGHQDGGIGMHHGHDVSPPVHHDPGPTTMPTDGGSHHHG
jgi:hypothetical protein